MRIGIDLGGTNIAAGVVDESGALLSKTRTPTHAVRGPEAVVRDMVQIAQKAAGDAGLRDGEISSVGIGSPGSIDTAAGTVIFSGNLGFTRLPLAAMFRAHWDVPVYLGNDANAAALGEFYAGAGRAYRSLIMVTLGTGVGGGIVFDGRIHGGFNGAAGEVGHMVIRQDGIPCSCGRKGCFETYASATALARQTREEMAGCAESALWTLSGGPDKVGGRTAFLAARQGDEAAERVLSRYFSYLACGLGNLINLFQPEALCIGGGLSGEGNYLTDRLRPLLRHECFDTGGRTTALCLAALGNDAGIIGAAMLGMGNG